MNKLNKLYDEFRDYFETYVNMAKEIEITSMAITQWKSRKSIKYCHAKRIEDKSNGYFNADSIMAIFHDASICKNPTSKGKTPKKEVA